MSFYSSRYYIQSCKAEAMYYAKKDNDVLKDEIDRLRKELDELKNILQRSGGTK